MISKVDKYKSIGDERGKLIALEENKEIPFEIKRIFYIYDTMNLARGNHAHYQTKQYLIALSGSCSVTLDDGYKKETYVLDEKNMGLFQDKLIWGTMHSFSNDCILLVLANDIYKKDDYIFDYDKFISEVSDVSNR